MDIKVIIATHKKYRMPDDDMYMPVFVGAEGKKDSDGNELDLGYVKDNTGDNISNLNGSFCELTGLYWAWKNVKSDYIGLVHYRRHFAVSIKNDNDIFDSIVTIKELSQFIPKIRVFVPERRNYYIESLYSHYQHTHYAIQLDETEKILIELYPEYWANYRKVVRQSGGYMFNMMIMEKTLSDEYCEWIFTILFELKNRLKMDNLSAFQGRFFGRISEIMFNVWLDKKVEIGQIKKDEIKELKYIHMEKTNWNRKGMAFLSAKFLGKKYEKSF